MDHNEAMSAAETAGVAESRAAECRAKAGLYGLLARILEEEIDQPLLDTLRGPLREPLAEAGVDPGPDFFGGDPGRLIEALAEEYAALFVVPGAVKPFASVFETGALFGKPCDKVAAAYREAGYEFRRRHSGEFPDHIGTMLGFVGRMLTDEAAALERGDEAATESCRKRREDFVVEHLGRWGPGWCHRARTAARHPFYAQVLGLAEKVLWEDISAAAGPRRLHKLAQLNGRPVKRLKYNAEFRKASGL
jgi:TorA maturation chaperone TorD